MTRQMASTAEQTAPKTVGEQRAYLQGAEDAQKVERALAKIDTEDLVEALAGAAIVIEEMANILRPTLPSLADNVFGAQLTKVRAAIAKATGQ